MVGADLLWTIKGLISEFKFAVDEWDVVLPAVNYVINHRKRGVLGGRTAIEVMTGLTPDTALRLALYSGTTLKDAVGGEATTAVVDHVWSRHSKPCTMR